MTVMSEMEKYLGQFPDNLEVNKCSPRYIAWETAWKTRTFEIEMYWKRATYFWAFTASIFGGYFLTARINPDNFPEKMYIEYLVICLGIIVATAWILANKGSKVWQENWEEHIDRLEKDISGPLYRTYFNTDSFSVSKVNEIVSWAFLTSWLGMALGFWLKENLFNTSGYCIDTIIAVTTIGLISILMSFLIYGQSKHKKTPKQMKTRPLPE